MKRLLIPVAAVLLFACGGEDVVRGPVRTSVMQTLNFEREEPKGVALGLNLDGWVSETNDGRSCNKPDFKGPEGTEGVDNELARMLPLLDLAGENAVESLVQIAINEGRLLVMLDVAMADDGTAEMTIRRGEDVPLLGTDGFILGGQTLALHESPELGATEGTLVGEVLETAPAAMELPIVVFSQLYVVKIDDAIFRMTLDEQGFVKSGMLAGGLLISQLLVILQTAGNFAGDFEALFGDAVRDSGDLARDDDGHCTAMSAAITFEAVPAFTF